MVGLNHFLVNKGLSYNPIEQIEWCKYTEQRQWLLLLLFLVYFLQYLYKQGYKKIVQIMDVEASKRKRMDGYHKCHLLGGF